MRLISADSIMHKMADMLNESGNPLLAEKAIALIDHEPTAFDKEKVIEDLSDWKNDAEKWAAKYDEVGDTDNIDLQDVAVRCYVIAIEIVEKGGIK